jgi:hypothetical protein
MEAGCRSLMHGLCDMCVAFALPFVTCVTLSLIVPLLQFAASVMLIAQGVVSMEWHMHTFCGMQIGAA